MYLDVFVLLRNVDFFLSAVSTKKSDKLIASSEYLHRFCRFTETL